MLENIIIIAVLVLAVVYLARRFVCRNTGCGCGCSGASASSPSGGCCSPGAPLKPLDGKGDGSSGCGCSRNN